jgi:hypothetical protein
MTDTFTRTTFETSRLLEFFTEKELQMQIGHAKELWSIALLKELIDNALDACESVDRCPEIDVEIEVDLMRVRDNGPGLPLATLERSLDYAVSSSVVRPAAPRCARPPAAASTGTHAGPKLAREGRA